MVNAFGHSRPHIAVPERIMDCPRAWASLHTVSRHSATCSKPAANIDVLNANFLDAESIARTTNCLCELQPSPPYHSFSQNKLRLLDLKD